MQAIGYVLAAVLLGAWLYASHVIAVRLLPVAATYLRVASAAVIGFALLVVLFGALSLLHLFRLWVAAPLLIGIAAAAHLALARRTDVREAIARDLECVGAAWREAGWARWVALAAIPVGVRTARGLVAPPLGWDALTYHLAKAGEWVQAGGFVPLAGPDANRGYDYLAPYGDVLWAWAMLPVHGDALLAIAGLLVWFAVALSAYACARCLGASVRAAFLAALAVALTPTVASLVTVAYVDNTVLALFLFGCTFAIRALDSRSRVDAVIAGVAFGLMAGTKMTGVVVVIAWAFIAITVAFVRRDGSVWPGILAAAAIAAPPYLRSWIGTGNPLFPFEVSLGGHVLFPGMTRLGEAPPDVQFSWWSLLADLSTPFVAADMPYVGMSGEFDRIALGPAVFALAPVGVLGAVSLARRGRGLLVVLLIAACGAVVATQITAATTLWTQPLVKTTQRYVLAVPAILTIFAASLDRRWVKLALAGAAAVGGMLSFPRGIGPAELETLAAAALAAVAAAAVVWIAVTWRPLRRRPGVAAGVALVGAALAVAGVGPLRARHRYDIYRDAARLRSFDMHYVQPLAVRAWPIWSALDRPNERFRIAVAAGPNATWFRYPLLGSRLQNEFVYVSPTADGSFVDHSDESNVARNLSVEAWLRRLLQADVDFFVVLTPLPPETGWAFGAPDLFALFAVSEDGTSAAFTFDKVRALAWLSAQTRGR